MTAVLKGVAVGAFGFVTFMTVVLYWADRFLVGGGRGGSPDVD